MSCVEHENRTRSPETRIQEFHRTPAGHEDAGDEIWHGWPAHWNQGGCCG